MRIIASFIRYTGFINFINDRISRVFLLILFQYYYTGFSILLTSCLTAIKNHDIKIFTTVYERSDRYLWSIKNPGEILNKLNSKGLLASSWSTYDFLTLYTALPYNRIKEKLTELIEKSFNMEGSLYLACNENCAYFLLLNNLNNIK